MNFSILVLKHCTNFQYPGYNSRMGIVETDHIITDDVTNEPHEDSNEIQVVEEEENPGQASTSGITNQGLEQNGIDDDDSSIDEHDIDLMDDANREKDIFRYKD